MQLLEVKGNIAKIVYNPTENHLLPSDFLLIEDSNQKLIAQIINIATTQNSTNNAAALRLLLSIDNNDNLSYYNGYIPLKSAKVIYIKSDEILELIKGEDNIYLGNLSNHNDCFVKVPLSLVDDRIYIQSDRYDKVKVFIQNLSSELIAKNKKVIILDFYGHYNTIKDVPRIKITESLKLPLNINAFNTILEYDTKDCPIEDKALIQSIVLELREYIKTVDNNFLPFTLFKTVIDKEFASNPISGLMLLRNKLWLYAQEGIFAEGKSDFEIINKILDNQNILIIDASNLETKWYKFAIQTIQEIIKTNCYITLSLNDFDLDKKSIISLYNKPGVIPIVSTAYDSKYKQIIKSLCKNQILFKPSTALSTEEAYNPFINRINTYEYILYGEADIYIPLIIELKSFDVNTKEMVNQNEISKEVDKFLSSPKKNIPDNPKINTDIPKPEFNEKTNVQNFSDIDDDFNDEDLDFLEAQNNEKISISDIKPDIENKDVIEDNYDVFSPISNYSDMDEEEQEELKEQGEKFELAESYKETEDPVQEEIIEEVYPENEISQSDDEDFLEEIYEETTDENINLDETENNIDLPQENIQDEELPDVEITEEPNELDFEEFDAINSDAEEEENENTENNISDNDAVIISSDAKNEDNIEKEENQDNDTADSEEINEDKSSILPIDEVITKIEEKAGNGEYPQETEVNKKEDIKSNEAENTEGTESKNIPVKTSPVVNTEIKEKQTPRLPYYEAANGTEEIENKIDFKIGDKVYHPKHGNGIIKGFARYSNNKVFCRIEFDDEGIRILEPLVSGLQKI